MATQVWQAAHQDWFNQIFFLFRIPQVQLTPPLLCLAIKAALAADLGDIRCFWML